MNHAIRHVALGAGVLAAGMLAACAGNHTAGQNDFTTVLPAHDLPGYAAIQHGRYLVKAGDCKACHTAPGGKPFAGGRAVPTPFGIIYSTNITPDPATGIGKWSEADFYHAMHTGTARDGHHLYPAFPYPWYTKVTSNDVRDIKAYLGTLPPVRQRNLPTELPWPFSMRSTMAVWNKLYFDEGTFKGDPKESAAWNRGAYLVRGLGHCGACHSPKNFAGAVKQSDALHGGHAEHAFAPALTGGLRDGLGGWSANEIVGYLKTGSNDKSSAAGPMAEVVTNSTQYLSDADLHAIATYLKAQPHPKSGEQTGRPDKNLMTLGGDVYADDCTACHMDHGQGLARVFPPLKGSSAIQAANADTLIRVVLGGADVPATQSRPTGLKMPAFNDKLDDAQIAALLTYIRNAWGNHASAVSNSEVAKMRKQMEHGHG
ncbi:MAG: c-type cytochrome [Rhodanobacteraceae bacterium]